MQKLLKQFPPTSQLNHDFHLKYSNKFDSALSLNCNLSPNDGLAELRELIYTLKQCKSENTQENVQQ